MQIQRESGKIYFLDKEDLLPGASGILKQSEKVTLILFSLLEHIFWSLPCSAESCRCMIHFCVDLSLSHMSWKKVTQSVTSFVYFVHSCKQENKVELENFWSSNQRCCVETAVGSCGKTAGSFADTFWLNVPDFSLWTLTLEVLQFGCHSNLLQLAQSTYTGAAAQQNITSITYSITPRTDKDIPSLLSRSYVTFVTRLNRG